jgi:hypothetical protein
MHTYLKEIFSGSTGMYAYLMKIFSFAPCMYTYRVLLFVCVHIGYCSLYVRRIDRAKNTTSKKIQDRSEEKRKDKNPEREEAELWRKKKPYHLHA